MTKYFTDPNDPELHRQIAALKARLDADPAFRVRWEARRQKELRRITAFGRQLELRAKPELIREQLWLARN